MRPNRLTQRSVTRATPAETRYTLWDDEYPGLGLTVFPSGHRSWVFKYRRGRRQRWHTIGPGAAYTLKEARQEAKRLIGEVVGGGDPATEKVESRDAATLRELVDRFMVVRAPLLKPSTVAEYRRLADLHILPRVGARQVCEVTRHDLARLHASMASTPYQANRVLAVAKLLLNFAEEAGMRPMGSNPARRLKPFRERHRERMLTADELGRLAKTLTLALDPGLPEARKTVGAADEPPEAAELRRLVRESPSAVLAVKLLLLTGARLSEVLKLRWEHVDLEGRRLDLPDSKTGQKVIPLGAPALQLLATTPRVEGSPWVVPSPRNAARCLTNLQLPWSHIRAAAGLPGVRIHDLRHCWASFAAMAGLGLPIIGAILGHRRYETTKRYAHLQADPLHAAADLVAGRIAAALEGNGKAGGGEVAQLRREGA